MEYILNKAQYDFLRNGCQSVNALVPELETVNLTDEDLKDLEQKGYVEGGKLTRETLELAKTLCQPLTVQRQRLINMDANIEQVLYYREEQAIISVSENTHGVKIEAPYDNSNDLEAIGQYLGNSVVKGLDFNLSLPTIEAFVLAGIWDCIRQNNAEKFFDDEIVDWVRKDALIEFLQKVDSSQSFAFYIKALNDLDLDRSTILKQLEILEQNGFIKGSERIELMDQTFELCLRFNHIKTMLQLTTALNNGTSTYGSEMMILQDGVTDILLMEIGAEQVNFLSMSSLEVVALLEAYYKEPKSFLGDLYDDERPVDSVVTEDVEDAVATKAPKFCSECGAKRTENAKFCPECGNKF